MRAAWCSPSASMRSPYHGGTYSSVSSRACAMRSRLTQGSNHCTSTNLAPALYAAAATARVRYSLPGSELTETIWSGWTLAPTWTARSASLEMVSSFTRARLPGSGLARLLDRACDPAGPRLAVARGARSARPSPPAAPATRAPARESAVAAPETRRGPVRPVYGSSVTSASPAITTPRSGRCSDTCPCVCPGVRTGRGGPGTSSSSSPANAAHLARALGERHAGEHHRRDHAQPARVLEVAQPRERSCS